MAKDHEPHAVIQGIDSEAATGTMTTYSLLFWDELPPNFAYLFEPLEGLLEVDEYLYFEEKVIAGFRSRTLRAILVTGIGVFTAEEKALSMLLQQRDERLARLTDDLTPEELEEVEDNSESPKPPITL